MLFYDLKLRSFPKIKYNFVLTGERLRVKTKKEDSLFELCFVERGEFIIKDRLGIRVCEAGHLYPISFAEECDIFTENEKPVKLMSVCIDADCELDVIDSEQLGEQETQGLMKNMLDGSHLLVAREGISSLAFDWLADYMKKIIACNNGERVGEETRALSIWLDFASRITKSSMNIIANDSNALPTSSVAYSEMVVSYIVKNYKKKFNVAELAEKLDISPNYLHAVFKHVKGVTIIDYLTAYRMKLAKIYIERFGIRVGVAAEMVGIDDPAYFSRIFKKTFGVSVNQLKKQK